MVIRLSAKNNRFYILLLVLLKTGALFCQNANPLDKIITISLTHKTVPEILKVLKNKAGVTFNYKSAILPKEELKSFEAINEKLSDILIRLLKPYYIEFKYFGGNTIVLKPAKYRSNINYTLSGYVFDKTNGEKLIGATVFCKYNKRGTVTNDYGFFTLTLPEDSLSLEIRYVGFINYKEKSINKANSFKIINLEPRPDLKEIEIREEGVSKSEHRPNSFYFNLKAIKDIPSFLGEPDVLRAIQMIPGVQGAGESAGGLNVRGGGTDQNLVLIDGVPVYNIVHVFGLFSIINPGAVNSVELIKGGFSAKHNGRLSSIVDIKLKDGNNQKISGKINIGMLLSSATIEGPLIKNKASFLVSFRRTYFVAFYKPIQYFSSRKALNNYSGWYYFYDLNAKLNFKIGNRDKLSANYFMGTDRGKITEKQIFTDSIESLQKRDHLKQLRWFTLMSSMRWDHILTDKIFMVTTAGITEYSTSFEDELTWETKPNPQIKTTNLNYKQTSGNRDLFIKTLFEINKFKNHRVTAGADFIYHRFNTGTLNYTTTLDDVDIDTTIGDKQIYSDEEVIFIEDNWKPVKRLSLNIGASFNSINVKNTRYFLLQPRFTGNYAFTKNLYINGSYSRMQQNLQILPNNSIGLPIDIWIPVTDYLKPQISDQYTFGAGYYFKTKFKFSIEGYYKSMQNLVELKEGALFLFGGYDWDKSFYIGDGIAKGLEVMIEKQTGKIKGWIGYCLAKSERKFADINNGKAFPYKYDRRHQVSVFIKFPTSKKHWDVSLSWLYTTGSPVTVPTSIYSMNGKTYYEFTQRNNLRMSNYHRMDISFTKTIKFKRNTRVWNIGAYNVYSHLNPLFISTSFLGENTVNKLKFYEVGLLPLIPFISYEISF
ncbi:MAG: TonB-dependent receptor [Bacteroidia bacterium]